MLNKAIKQKNNLIQNLQVNFIYATVMVLCCNSQYIQFLHCSSTTYFGLVENQHFVINDSTLTRNKQKIPTKDVYAIGEDSEGLILFAYCSQQDFVKITFYCNEKCTIVTAQQPIQPMSAQATGGQRVTYFQKQITIKYLPMYANGNWLIYTRLIMFPFGVPKNMPNYQNCSKVQFQSDLSSNNSKNIISSNENIQKIGAIVGGVVGGVIFLTIIGIIVYKKWILSKTVERVFDQVTSETIKL